MIQEIKAWYRFFTVLAQTRSWEGTIDQLNAEAARLRYARRAGR